MYIIIIYNIIHIYLLYIYIYNYIYIIIYIYIYIYKGVSIIYLIMRLLNNCTMHFLIIFIETLRLPHAR